MMFSIAFLNVNLVAQDHWSGLNDTTSTISRVGKVGIGTNSPIGMLHTVGSMVVGNSMGDFVFSTAWVQGQHFLAIAPNKSGPGSTDWSWDMELRLDGLTGELTKNVPSSTSIAYSVNYNGDKTFKVFGSGEVAIDGPMAIGELVTSVPSGYKLAVEEGIITEKVRVQLCDEGVTWCDYVFNDNYDLKSIAEIKEFVSKQGHLPGFPSAGDIEADGGFELKQITLLQQEKIEELYLYIMQLKDELDEIRENNTQLLLGKTEKNED
jgi:hypothetical protein